MNQRTNYDDTIQNFEIGDNLIVVSDSYENKYGSAFKAGTKVTVKMVSPSDEGCETFAYLVCSEEYYFSQFHLASELMKVE